MTDCPVPVAAIRAALEDIPETVAHDEPAPPQAGDIYVVPGHERALNPETPIVVGDRGTGKSFWSAALVDPTLRQHLIARQFRRLNLGSCGVSWGHGSTPQQDAYPSPKVLRNLRDEGHQAEDIWRAIILHHLVPVIDQKLPGKRWSERVSFIEKNPEEEENWLAEIDEKLSEQNNRHMIVFDALDRVARDWATTREIVGGLLRTCLDLRGYQAIRLKLFMRPDMWEDQDLWAFPDASKLHHARVTLEWRRSDLYGLLWHWLANNAHSSNKFREWAKQEKSANFKEITINNKTIYEIPNELKVNDEKQAEFLGAIASPYMGRDKRRGKTYSWIPNHLADAKGQVSPRSFLIALRHATRKKKEDTRPQVLHYESIKEGVQEASRIRREELKEDYPWIEEVLNALHGTTVPITESEAKNRWRSARIMAIVAREGDEDDNKPVPPHALEGVSEGGDQEERLIRALVEIGVMYRLKDDRLNIPDLFRVAAGIGRKGGVKAIR